MNIKVIMLILLSFFYPLEIISQIQIPKDLKSTDLDLGIRSNEFLQNKPRGPVTFQYNSNRLLLNNSILDNGFLMSESIFQEWIGAGWQNTSKRNCIYNNENLLIEDLYQDWIDTNWVNSLKMNR
jgi:hypothetical protein